MEDQIANIVLIMSSFLMIAVFSSMILKKINFPYTIGLVLVGGILGALAFHSEAFKIFRSIELSPGIILYLVLPTLIFEAAINIDFQILKKNIIPILLLAVLGRSCPRPLSVLVYLTLQLYPSWERLCLVR